MTEWPSMGARPPVFSVVGFQNSGKTLLIESLVRTARADGYRVAVVKHDGHADETSGGENPDWEKPLSDTERAAKAGASWTLLASRSNWMLHAWQDETEGIDSWLDILMENARRRDRMPDVIFVEGAKQSRLPKIAVVRSQAEWDQLVHDGTSHVIAVCISVNAKLIERLDVGARLTFLHHQSADIWRFLQHYCENKNLDKKF